MLPDRGGQPATPAEPPAQAPTPPPPTTGSEALTTRGRIVRIRHVAPDDGDALVALNERTSDRSLYQRFFALNRRVADSYVAGLVEARDPGHDHDHAALVALLDDRVVAVAGYDRVGPGEAEVALLVEDAYQGEGLGTLLLEHLAAAARAAGFSALVADVLVLNRQMAGVFASSGLPTTRSVDEGVAHFRISTTPDEATLAAVDRREERAERASLEPLFAPRSVAVVGAGRRGGAGRAVLKAIMAGEYAGSLYPVNPHAASLAGLRCYPTVCDVPAPLDLALVAVPVPALEPVLRDCAQARVPAVVVLTSGLGEVGGEGAELQDRLLRTAREAGIRLVGPDSIGVLSTDPMVSLTAWSSPVRPVRGSLAVAAQSGAVAVALVDAAGRSGLGVADVVSLGNKADVSGNDLLLRWWHDDRVRVVALYLESLGNPRKFARLARRVAATKPVLVVKGGRSAAARRAGRARAAAAPSDAAVDALFAQAGVLRTDTVEEMLDAARVLAWQPLPAGGRVAVVGNGVGVAVLACDAAQAAGLEVPTLSEKVRRDLPGPARDNPVDLGAGATKGRLRRALDVLAASGEVDALVVVLAATVTRAPEELLAGATRARLPTVAVAIGGTDTPVRLTGDHGHQVPVFSFPESAVRALGHAVRYGRWRRSSRGSVPDLPGTRPRAARETLDTVLLRDPTGGWAGEQEGRDLLAAYGVRVAARAATSASGAAPRGRVELAVAVVQEPTFGPVLTLAPGTERTGGLVDPVVRLLPLTDADAAAMVADLPHGPALVDLLLRVSAMVHDVPETVELALDPVLLGEDGAVVAEVRVRVAPPASGPSALLRDL